MQFHVKRLRAFYLNWIRALYKFRYNNNNNNNICLRVYDHRNGLQSMCERQMETAQAAKSDLNVHGHKCGA